MRAFITGSHAYGAPRNDSDVDLVVRADADVEDALLHLQTIGGGDGEGSLSGTIRFGRLNLIIAKTDDEYGKWRDGTDRLRALGRLVSRDEAKALFVALLGR